MEIKRDIYLNELSHSRHNGMIKIITGMRRCGKSYLLFTLFSKYLRSEGVDDSHIICVDLEDRRNMSLRNPDTLLQYIDGKMVDNKMYYVLLDEVQHVDEFADVLNSYLKMENADVYVTGSNSKFLSKDVITEFRGRGYEIRVSPLSFREFMSVYEGSMQQGLEEYLTYGGLPQVLAISDESKKMEYLSSLFEKVYLTDIKERYKIRNDSDLEELINIAASSIGGLVNPSRIENTFLSVMHSPISYNTIKSYLDILQDAFLLEKSVRYDIKGRRYVDTPAKYYFTDMGLRNARINFRQHEVSHLMENIIYNELRLRGLRVDVGMVVVNEKDNCGLSKRRQLEVDFVCNQGSRRLYIQSAFRLSTNEKREQELRSLRNIGDSFQKFVITEEPIKKYHNDEGVIFMNIYEFLMDGESLKG